MVSVTGELVVVGTVEGDVVLELEWQPPLARTAASISERAQVDDRRVTSPMVLRRCDRTGAGL
jgi:hypothetical protein